LGRQNSFREFQVPAKPGDHVKAYSYQLVPIIYATKEKVLLWCVIHLFSTPFTIEIYLRREANEDVAQFAKLMYEYLIEIGPPEFVRLKKVRVRQPHLLHKEQIRPMFTV
jgi:hypothetical protein